MSAYILLKEVSRMSSNCNIMLNELKNDIKNSSLSDNQKKDMLFKISNILTSINSVNINTIFDYSSDDSGYSTDRSTPSSPYKN
jgi:hypothetical protein